MLAAHAGSYALAAVAALAVAGLAPRGLSDPRAAPVAVAGLLAVAGTLLAANYLAHRWALSAAALRLARDADWTAEAVQRLLERATAEDRRGTRAVGVVIDRLTSGGASTRLARFALRRIGADAVARVAEVLAGARADDEPMAKQVQREVLAVLERERRRHLFALLAFVGGIIAAAVVARLGAVRA
jgi:hypothetical protein